MSRLFEPFPLGGLKLKNRFVRSATCENLTSEERLPSEEMIRLYEALAAGGVGLIITSATRPDRSWDKREFATWKRLAFDRDEMIPAFQAFTRRVQAAGARIALQLGSFYKFYGDFVGPSDAAYMRSASVKDQETIVPRALTLDEIQEIIGKYVAAGFRAYQAGFDAVQLGAGHGFPLGQFLSPFFNRRTDAYGGGPENRARMLSEIVRGIKAQAGQDFPVLLKINAADFIPGGMTPERAAETAAVLAENGADALETSGGTLGQEMSQFGPSDPRRWAEAYFRDSAAVIKSRVKVPIILVGGLRSPALMDEILTLGQADLFSLSRPLIREPGLVNRWRSGDLEPSDCNQCNGCLDRLMKGEPVECVC
ncbi:MAG: NADH:flavin oxidoreductase [Thermodesulfobacteriota bacterium]